jgi:hypothetical protein
MSRHRTACRKALESVAMAFRARFRPISLKCAGYYLFLRSRIEYLL